MNNKLTPSYLSDLCPPNVADKTNYNLRNVTNTSTIASKKNYFLKSFLPSTIKLWNELPKDLKMAKTLDAFKVKLSSHLKMFHSYKPHIYSPNKNFDYIARLRMGLSGLNAHRKKYHFIQHADCLFCSHKKEDTIHFLLECPRHTVARTAMLSSLTNFLPTQYRNLINSDTKGKKKEFCNILTFGTLRNEEVDIKIFTAVSVFISKTGRFI